MTVTKEDLDLNLDDLERAAANLMSYSSDESSSEEENEELEDRLARLAINKKQPSVGVSYPTDLLVAARAAAMDSSSSSSSCELDSDDDSSSSSDEKDD